MAEIAEIAEKEEPNSKIIIKKKKKTKKKNIKIKKNK